MSNWRRQRAFIGEKVPENGSFCHQLRSGRVGCAYLIYPVQGGRSWSAADSPNLCTNLNTPDASTRNICSSSFVFIDVEWRRQGRSLAKKYPKMALFGTTAVKVVTPDQLRDRVGCAYLIYPVQGVRAAGLQLTPLIYARIWNSGCIN